MQRVQDQALTYYQFEMWRDAPFRHGIFTRLGGVSPAPWAGLNIGGTVGDSLEAVAQNHQLIYRALGVEQACSVWQVHGADTVVVTNLPKGRKWINRADGMVTNRAAMPLLMRFADCVPILFYDPQQNAVGIAHAGWRGTLAGAQLSVLESLKTAFGSQAADVQVGIGPSIGPQAYQVGEEVVDEARAVFDDLAGIIWRAADGSAYFNLWEANRRRLQMAGVQKIEVAEICTYTQTDEFFSHRGEHGKTGRFGAMIVL